ncbi:redox-regulated ATPase YchF [Candidatus Wolfebacteria bacterium CG10_big_fil_rev_8_21_14_0_10_31_9]|uniref:Redox-regulated ATPase YchF n=1 Tax=Candidatus Wolfebacteria bacterium CG10_big_fil_rev_8_21_14_0_10_31_9 TaxID=1975070 RepID=A0A2H0RD28_9BACT|nr:MAG: redox-regulated ATPase YchF [Candidatus Wolfebacteria bacterium CG10_big_fil_rev_8_21_14_0_10_31_9]
MKLSIGIVGLPNVGKSTLFKILTNQNITIANYPFATIDPNVGIVPVPDERLDKLAKMSQSKKTIPAAVEFYDIAGLVKGANNGEGLGNKFLSHIRDVNAIVQVVRVFESAEIIHVENKVNPISDIETINTELILKDLETVEKRLSKLESEAKTGDKNKQKDVENIKKALDILNNGELANKLSEDILDEQAIKEMNLLTAKKQIYLLNGSESDVSEELKNKIKELGADYLIMNLADAQNVNELIVKAYDILGLISFLTTGEDETRAWTIRKGAKAPEASCAIHTDFENKFIRAEVINWQKLLEAADWNKARQKGMIRTEGKEYIVQDGDVIVVRHS